MEDKKPMTEEITTEKKIAEEKTTETISTEKTLTEKTQFEEKIIKEKNAEKITSNVGPFISNPVRFGLTLLGIFFGTLGLWMLFAQLESAALAPGKITVDTNRKTIQHLEGGIVKKIYVHEDSQVKKGDLLIALEDTKARVSLELLREQANSLRALEARLLAERDKTTTIQFSDALKQQQNDPKAKKIMEGQIAIFNANNQSFNDQLSILKQRIAQLEKEIESTQAQASSDNKQLKLIEEEIEAVAYLEKQKLIAKPRLLALQREEARLIGNRDENLGQVERLKQKIGETQTQTIGLKNNRQRETLKELRATQHELVDVLEREKAAADILARIQIYAPRDGRIVGLKIHTIGGVISPGAPIMDIVPSQDKLVIEARVNPLDIDIVHQGLLAKVQLSAYKQRHMPQLNGVVTRISADSIEDPQTGALYYQARVTIDQEDLKKLNRNIILYPGMPAHVMIITDKRTPIEYFTAPIRDSFHRAFREE